MFEASELAALRSRSAFLGVKLVNHENGFGLRSPNSFCTASLCTLGRCSFSALPCSAEQTAKGQSNCDQTRGSLLDFRFDHYPASVGIGK